MMLFYASMMMLPNSSSSINLSTIMMLNGIKYDTKWHTKNAFSATLKKAFSWVQNNITNYGGFF